MQKYMLKILNKAHYIGQRLTCTKYMVKILDKAHNKKFYIGQRSKCVKYMVKIQVKGQYIPEIIHNEINCFTG